MTASTLAAAWRAARVPVAGIHLDSGACSRQSNAVIDATAQHARYEAEVGGYVAAQAATSALDACRSAFANLTGTPDAQVAFTTGANDSLDLVLGSWTGERTLACLPGEFGPSLAVMAANGFDVRLLPVDDDGRLDLDATESVLSSNPPALVHFTPLASHRGLAQPLAEAVGLCRRAGVPVVVDAAQALGHLDCAVGADATYSTSRKWLAGPRGVGILAVGSELGQRLTPRLSLGDDLPLAVRLEHGEASVASRIGFAVAVGEHLAAGPAAVRTCLAEVGRQTREACADLAGWRVAEPLSEPTAITTLVPPDGVDPVKVRSWLIAERGIVTTAAEVLRAPFELTVPVLRLSPHVDTTPDDLHAAIDALTAATSQV